jgi:hypothetical protein
MGEIKSPSRTHQRKTSDIAKLLQDTSISDKALEPSFQKLDDDDISTLRGVPPSATLVLFTPAIPSRFDIDPFEPLGKALCRYHRTVKHIPYRPDVGMTVTHSAFCVDAGSVIIIVCQVTENHGPVSSGSLKGQQNFARDVGDLAKSYDAPVLLVEIGEGDCSKEFDLVVKCNDYSSQTLRRVADLIFQG